MLVRLSVALAVFVLAVVPSMSPAQTKHLRIGVSLYSQTIPLYIEMRKGMEAEAAKRGIELNFSVLGHGCAAAVRSDREFRHHQSRLDSVFALR
jgi:ABC-type sugar transport system substrate-binding protein